MKTDHHHHHHHHHHHNPHQRHPNGGGGGSETQTVESTSPSAYNTPQIKSVLKKYKMSAVKSLQGPSSAIYAMDCKAAALIYHESTAAAKAAAAAMAAATAYANYGVVAAAAAAAANNTAGTGHMPAALTGAACSPGPGIVLPEPIKPIPGVAPVAGLTTIAAAPTTTVLASKKQQTTITTTTPTGALSASSASSSPQPLKYSKDVLRLRPLIDDADDDPPDAMIKEREKRHLEFPIPILSAPDKHCSEHGETLLDGDYISCFVVGGERRLCLPQLLNTVLQDFSIAQINALCDELRINCSRCTSEQLQELKDSGVLPAGASSCGLITQTDAERLVGALTLAQDTPTPLFALRSGEASSFDLHHPHHPHHHAHLGASDVLERIRHLKKDLLARANAERIKLILVHHRCFGRGYGLFDLEQFVSEDSKCVQCIECKYQLQPQHFVRHRHGKPENFTCHWGFDSTSWRNYLMAWDEDDAKVEEAFEQVKRKRFDVKRKLELEPFQPIKKHKLLSTPSQKDDTASPTLGTGPASYGPNGAAAAAAYPPMYYQSPLAAQTDPDSYVRMGWALLEMATRESSAFRPWNPMMASKQRPCSPCVPPYLSRGPPVLQNPERVVPISEWERFEPHYQPNVALAPAVSTSSLPPPPPPQPPQQQQQQQQQQPQQPQQHHHLLIASQQQSTNHNRTTATTLTTLTTAKTEPAAAAVASVVRSSSSSSGSEQQRRDEETIKYEKQDVAKVAAEAEENVNGDDDDDCGSEIEVTAVDLRDSSTTNSSIAATAASVVVVVDAEHKIKPHLSDAETPTQLLRESGKESTPEPDRGDATSPAKATSTTTDSDAAAMPTTVITIKDEAPPVAAAPLVLLSTSRSHSRSALVTPPTSPPSQICKEEPQETVAYNNASPLTENPRSLAQMVASFEERFLLLKPKLEVREAVRDFLDQLLLRDKELPKRTIKRETDSPVMLNSHHKVEGET